MKTTLLILCLGTALITLSQTGSPPANNAGTATKADFGWYRGGNNPVGAAFTNDVLGTMWPADIWLKTNGTTRGRFTHNNALFCLNSPGDGLELINSQPSTGPAGIGNIAIFTSPGFTNGTEIRIAISGNKVCWNFSHRAKNT